MFILVKHILLIKCNKRRVSSFQIKCSYPLLISINAVSYFFTSFIIIYFYLLVIHLWAYTTVENNIQSKSSQFRASVLQSFAKLKAHH